MADSYSSTMPSSHGNIAAEVAAGSSLDSGGKTLASNVPDVQLVTEQVLQVSDYPLINADEYPDEIVHVPQVNFESREDRMYLQSASQNHHFLVQRGVRNIKRQLQHTVLDGPL